METFWNASEGRKGRVGRGSLPMHRALACAAALGRVLLVLMLLIGVAAGISRTSSRAPRPSVDRSTRPWLEQLGRMDAALGRGNIRGAIRPWNEAYSAALKNGGWDGMAAVGEAHFRLMRHVMGTGTAMAAASPGAVRGIFETTRLRAYRQGSAEGMERAAQGFAALGDAVLAGNCRELAVQLAARRGGR